jgi:minor extracellular serine protease Vpr
MIGYLDGLRAKDRLASGAVDTSVDFTTKPLPINPARLASFTSKGPNVDRAIKPDLVAVGTSVYTAQLSVNGQPAYAALDGTSFSSPIVAGAAALLKAYRPGLRAEQYKSLLANSAAAFSSEQDVLPIQQTGAGLLDVSAAVRSTIAATPSALNFGSGGGTVESTQRFLVQNLSGKADTFAVSATALKDGVVPQVTPNSVELPPGASAEIAIRLSGASLPVRAYDGFVILRGTQTDVATRIPYWYAVTDRTPASITVSELPDSAERASTQDFLVRTLDAAGVPVDIQPAVKATSTGARVSVVESFNSRYPGFYHIRVRLSSEPGDNIFEIQAGDVTTRITINGA